MIVAQESGEGRLKIFGRRRALAMIGGAAVASGLSGATLSGIARAAADERVIRVAILKFGSVAWQLDVIKRHGIDRAEGIRIETLELASNQAILVALQAGRVDTIVSDLFWVALQRSSGADWSFAPYSSALGAVEVPAASPLRSFDDLAGCRLGIAGSPLDKSWLLLRLLSRQRGGRDLDASVEKSFGAPPLLAEQLAVGRLDAVLTYWQFAARLEASGARRLLGMDEAMRELGFADPVPLVGYVISRDWATRNRAVVDGFRRACARADEIMASSNEEWLTLAPLTGAASAAELDRLRDAFRRGIPARGDDVAHAAARRLYQLLARVGGAALVGPGATLPEGIFLDDLDG
jgi:NitT/TauT family transport system substrate-binding protein